VVLARDRQTLSLGRWDRRRARGAREGRNCGAHEGAIKARADVYQIENVKEAQHFHQKLLDLRAENVLYIRIPILGVAFDINDLGIFGGLAMAILLLWLRFSLWNERHNLQLCMDEANPGDMKAVYRYLSMRQLLTIPPSLGGTEKLEGVWRWLARGLFSLPALAYGLVVGYDILFSASLPPTVGLIVDLWIEGFCLLIVAGLSALAIHLLGDIDSLWEEFAEKRPHRTRLAPEPYPAQSPSARRCPSLTQRPLSPQARRIDTVRAGPRCPRSRRVGNATACFMQREPNVLLCESRNKARTCARHHLKTRILPGHP
jgi:hypothetical protein